MKTEEREERLENGVSIEVYRENIPVTGLCKEFCSWERWISEIRTTDLLKWTNTTTPPREFNDTGFDRGS